MKAGVSMMLSPLTLANCGSKESNLSWGVVEKSDPGLPEIKTTVSVFLLTIEGLVKILRRQSMTKLQTPKGNTYHLQGLTYSCYLNTENM